MFPASSSGPAVVFQCCACRALGSAVDVVVAPDGARAGLVCPLCRFTSWLPAAGHHAAHHAAHHAQGGAEPGRTTATVEGPRPLAAPAAPAPSLSPFSPTGEAASAMPPITMPSTTSMVPSMPSTLLAPTEAPPLPITALVPAAPRALQTTFDPDTGERIRARLRQLPAPTLEQEHLRERFDELLATSWHQETGHKQLLKSASLAGELAYVGARYRAVLDVVRDEPRARAAQQELLTLAMVTMQTSKELGSLGPGSIGESKSTAKTVAAVLLIVAILVGGIVFVRLIRSSFAEMQKIDS